MDFMNVAHLNPNSRHISTRRKGKRAGWSVMLRTVIIVVIIFTYFAFDFLYHTQISPANLYLGFVYRRGGGYDFFILISYAIVALVFLPVRLEKPSDWAIITLYLFSYFPATLMARYVLEMKDYIYMLALLFMGLGVISTITAYRRRYTAVMKSYKRLSSISERRWAKIFLLSLFVMLILVYLWHSHFHFSLSFGSMYVRRLSFRQYRGTLLAYAVSVGNSLLAVFLIYFFFVEKRWKYILLLFLAVLAIFSLEGTKTSFLIPLFLLFVGYLSMWKKPYKLFFIYLLPFVLIGSVFVEEVLFHSSFVRVYMVRRMFTVPGFLNALYFTFFSHHPKALLTDSIGRWFLPPVYPVSVPFIIGRTYFLETTNANTGIWMGWFAEFGAMGVLLVSALAGIVLRFIDNLTIKRAPLLGYLTCAYIGIVWSEQMFQTSFFSGGVLYLIIGIALLIKEPRYRALNGGAR